MLPYSRQELRTWVEIDKKALEHNLKTFLKLASKRTRLMAVIKSNAYGHGLVQTAKLLVGSKSSVANNDLLWFGVDSITEALRLRKEGIKNPIFVLGATLPARMIEAAGENIILTISNFESLEFLQKLKQHPVFHLKIDTGMHRQGFLPSDIPRLIKRLKISKLVPAGVYTHFASAKDAAYPTYTNEQLGKFKIAVSKLEKVGFSAKGSAASGGKNLICHAAASGGSLLFPEARLDMIRIGMSLYGYWPSIEAKIREEELGINLRPALSWHTLVVEIKKIKKGSYVSYDLTEKVARDIKIAVLPIGYWHGYDRGLSNIGEVLIRGKRAKILGRVCMDMVIVDVTDISGAKVGDRATLIGSQGKQEIWADELALKIGTSQYEFLTRINPLIRRTII